MFTLWSNFYNIYPKTIERIILDLYVMLYHGTDKAVINPMLLTAINPYLKYNIPARWLWPVIVYLRKEGLEVIIPESKMEWFNGSLDYAVTAENFLKK